MTETGVLDPNNLNANETQNRSNNHRRNKQPFRNPRHFHNRPFNNSNYDSYQNYQEDYGYSNYANSQTNHYDFYGQAEHNFNGHSSNHNFYQNRNTNFRPHSSWHKPKKTNTDNKEKPSNQTGEINVEKNESKRNKQRAKKPLDAKDTKPKEPAAKAPTKDKFANLSRSEMLIDQLKKNKCECMVCYSVIRNDKQIWSCECCFHIFHLSCIKKWALSPAAKIAENSPKWRCPGCQTIFDAVPNKYVCFCGKKTNPEKENRPFYQLKLIPHSCNEVCAKSLATSGQLEGLECKHKCTDICHPGPCHPCEALVNRTCNCQSFSNSFKFCLT